MTDILMKQPEGKYVLVKDPNRVRKFFFFNSIRLLSPAPEPSRLLLPCLNFLIAWFPSCLWLCSRHYASFYSLSSVFTPSLFLHSLQRTKKTKLASMATSQSRRNSRWPACCDHVNIVVYLYVHYAACVSHHPQMYLLWERHAFISSDSCDSAWGKSKGPGLRNSGKVHHRTSRGRDVFAFDMPRTAGAG